VIPRLHPLARTAIALIVLLTPGARCLSQSSFAANLTPLQVLTPERSRQFTAFGGDSARSLTPFVVGGAVGGALGAYLGLLSRYTCESAACVQRHRAAPYLGALGGAAAGVALVALLDHLPHRQVSHPNRTAQRPDTCRPLMPELSRAPAPERKYR
jgi:hypothetical protein